MEGGKSAIFLLSDSVIYRTELGVCSLQITLLTLTLGQQLEAGSARPVTRLLIPANQLQAVLRGIADGANEIREKLQSQAKDDGGKGAAATAKKKPAGKPAAKK